MRARYLRNAEFDHDDQQEGQSVPPRARARRRHTWRAASDLTEALQGDRMAATCSTVAMTGGRGTVLMQGPRGNGKTVLLDGFGARLSSKAGKRRSDFPPLGAAP